MMFHRMITVVIALMTIATAAHAQNANSLMAPGAKVEKRAGDMKFTEGPVWIPARKVLVFSDIPNSKLMQWSEADGLSVFRESEQANGNILDLQGRLVSCQHAGRNLVRQEADGSITGLINHFEGQSLNSPNDVAIRSDGTLWFTDPHWGLKGEREIPGNWVYRFDPATGKTEAVVKDLAMPNGINFSPDESRIYIADTGGHPTHPDSAFQKLPAGIHCYEVTKEGQLGKKLFTIEEGSDGMAVDVEGNLYTTHDSVNIYSADGKLLERIATPEAPANVTFGGADFKTLFITARTSLYSVRMKYAGAKPPGAKW